MKKCSKCKIEKDFSSFGKRKASKDGLSYICKDCKSLLDKEYSKKNKESIKEYLKMYYEDNKEHLKEKSKKNYIDNIESIKDKNKKYYLDNSDSIKNRSNKFYLENKDKIKEKRKKDYKNNPDKFKDKSKEFYNNNKDKYLDYSKKYRIINKENIRKYKKDYYKNNKERICEYMRNYWNSKKYIKSWRQLLYRYLKSVKKKKNGSTYSILKYTPEMLKMRIECQFKEGMSWENYGEWEIDHKKPISKFDIDTDPHIVNSLCNLQPLWKFDNIKKSNKWK